MSKKNKLTVVYTEDTVDYNIKHFWDSRTGKRYKRVEWKHLGCDIEWYEIGKMEIDTFIPIKDYADLEKESQKKNGN